MSRWKFKGYDARTDRDLARYGYRVVYKSDEELKARQDRRDWTSPFSREKTVRKSAEDEADDLHYDWTRDYGDEVMVKVWKDDRLLIIRGWE